MVNKNCPKCKGTGRVKEKDGTFKICFDCLIKGEFDQHSKEIKETNIKI